MTVSKARLRQAARRSAGLLWQRSRKDWRGTWRWGHNLGPTLRHVLAPLPLSDRECTLVTELRRTGIASDHIGALFGDPALLPAVRTAVEQIEKGQAHELARASAAIDEGREKPFLYLPLGKRTRLDLDSVFADVANRLAPVADAYFGMRTQVRSYAVWRNLASSHEEADSQLWHRDREDLQILKAFLYLEEVASGNGPFWYAPGTHGLGPIPGVAESEIQRGVERSTDAQMAEVLEPEAWVEATGRAGTLVLADTRGYHKGGRAVTGDRLLLTVLFTSQDSGVREWFDRSGQVAPIDQRERFRWSRGS